MAPGLGFLIKFLGLIVDKEKVGNLSFSSFLVFWQLDREDELIEQFIDCER
jgi:hypothetical protein